ncbi:MAG: phytanoyl-CoA dioxygenase family protein [Armatimonadota bacterium]
MRFEAFTDSRTVLDQPALLRQRMQEEGYLFISSLVPRPDVDEVYHAIMQICREEGWAVENNLAVGEPRLEGHDDWWAVYDRVQCLEKFHALAHHPSIIQVIKAIVQEPVLVHPRNIARITFPATAHYTTPPHQDYPLIQGTPDTYTVWILLCDCPTELGGLAVLPGSHHVGLLPVHPASGPGGLSVDTSRWGTTGGQTTVASSLEEASRNPARNRRDPRAGCGRVLCPPGTCRGTGRDARGTAIREPMLASAPFSIFC